MSYNYNQGPYPGQEPPPGAYPPPPGAYPPPPQGGYPQGGFAPPPQAGYPPQGGYPSAPTPGFQYGGPMGGDPYQAPAAGYGAGGYSNPEDPEVKGFDFNDASIRRGFIKKVYSILMVQLSITLAFIALFVYHEPTQRYVQGSMTLFIVALVMMLVCMFTLVCCGEVRRKAPTNFIVLFLFTIAESFLLGVTATKYAPTEVMMAVGITAAVCLALTLFAFQTKYDFTMMGGILVVAVVVLLIFGIVAMIVRTKIVSLVYASIGALLFSIYLVYDTQLMMGGSHKYSISPEEYVFAALNIYLDVVNIFLFILQIIGASKD